LLDHPCDPDGYEFAAFAARFGLPAMAMIAIGRTADVWATAVELFGIIDWLTEPQHEDPTLQQL